MKYVYLVEYCPGQDDSSYVDSVWTSEKRAQDRATLLGQDTDWFGLPQYFDVHKCLVNVVEEDDTE